jgi:hypothetical protein
MDSAIISCHRILYLYNIIQQEDITGYNITKLDYPTDPEQLCRTVDKAINHANYSTLSVELKKIWMEDKFHYVSWIRDSLSSLGKKISKETNDKENT